MEILIIAGVGGAVVFIVVVLGCVFGRKKESYSTKKWGQVTAHVKKNRTYENDVAAVWGQPTQRNEYQIQYIVDKQTYKRYVPNSTGYAPAGSLKILYNKKHPGRFVVVHGKVVERENGKLVIEEE